jgi:uncharacterized protein YeeX (DUF496 family)
MSGLRVENAKPMDSLPFIVTSYSKDLESIQKKFSSNIYSPNLDLNGRIGYMTEYLTDNYDAQSRLFQVVKDMELMGADIGEIEDTVSIRFKNKKRVNAIMNGEYIAPNISEARIESIIERLYDENPVNAARVEDEFLTATDIFEDMRMDLEAIELGEGPESFRETIDFTLNPPSVQNQGTPGLTGIESVAEVELPLPVGIGTPVNASLFANNNTLGNQFNLLPNNVKFDKLFPQG